LKKIQIVQEYERAVIFRLGRLLPGGAKGPGTDNNNDITKKFIVFCISLFLLHPLCPPGTI